MNSEMMYEQVSKTEGRDNPLPLPGSVQELTELLANKLGKTGTDYKVKHHRAHMCSIIYLVGVVVNVQENSSFIYGLT